MKPQGAPALTWYEATARPVLPRAPLRAVVETETCVVGGGLAGLCTAHELARHGRAVVLIEADRLGAGASGRNGGFVSPGFALGLDDLVASVGLPAAQCLYAYSAAGHSFVQDFVLAADAADPQAAIHMGNGVLVALRAPDRAGLLACRDDMAARFGINQSFLETSTVRQLARSDRYHQGLHSESGFHIHPLNYVRALADAVNRAGGTIYESTRACSIASRGGGHVVATEHGEIRTRHVVVCVSAYDRQLAPAIGRAVLPVSTYIAVTERLGARAQLAIATRAAIADTRRAGDYYRLVDGDRILWGGRITTRQSQPRRLAELMRRDMLSVYPQLATGASGLPRMDYAWAGLMGYARHKMPIIGEIAPGIWAATAFGGHGLNTTAMAGMLIAQAIAGEADEVRRFAGFGPVWAGGLAGRAAVQLSYWTMQARDWQDERRAISVAKPAAG